MRYYIVTTTKFASMCLDYLTYGATQSNWLSNIDIGDIIFLSQFSYKSQVLFGPLQVTKSLFYNKEIIYPQQRYFYRIQLKPQDKIRVIEETDLYLNGIQSNNTTFFFRIINLIQQNKHLHCISLTNDEGVAICEAFQKFGLDYEKELQGNRLVNELKTVDRRYICGTNNFDKKGFFVSESDFETYLILSLKHRNSNEYKSLSQLLGKYENNALESSEIYNQFIFGNAYPADLAILNENNINVFELKKDNLTYNMFQQLEKEIKKHLYYSMLSDRIEMIRNIKRFNFYLISLKASDNTKLKGSIFEKFYYLSKRMDSSRENTITFAEYSIQNNAVLLKEV